MKQTITYNNRKMELPFKLTRGLSQSTAMVERTNPFSGQSIELPGFAAAVYDHTVYLNHMAEKKDRATNQEPGISEHQKDWQRVRDGINFFRRYFVAEYMVLLD